MKRVVALMAVVLAVQLISACGKGATEDAKAQESQPYSVGTDEQIKQPEEQVDEVVEQFFEEHPVLTLQEIADSLTEMLTTPDESHRYVSIDDDTIAFTFWIDGTAEMAEALSSDETPQTESVKQFKDSWSGIVSNWTEIADGVLEMIEASGLKDGHILIMLLDDRDQSAPLFAIYDGEVVKDIVNGIEK